jgi:hypothetical protein
MIILSDPFKSVQLTAGASCSSHGLSTPDEVSADTQRVKTASNTTGQHFYYTIFVWKYHGTSTSYNHSVRRLG